MHNTLLISLLNYYSTSSKRNEMGNFIKKHYLARKGTPGYSKKEHSMSFLLVV